MRFEYGLMRSPKNIMFGCGQRHALGDVVKRIGSKVLVCTDQRFGALDIMADMRADMEKHGLTVNVFDGTEAELPLESIVNCVKQYSSFDPDVIVGLGGGSCLDMAKLVSLLLTYDGPLSNFYGEFKVSGPIRPVIAVPTTSGTGSEVTPVAVLADPERATKIGISSPELIPHTAICDPELTVTCPKGLTAISGADALAHAIEAYTAISREADPMMASSRVFVGKNGLSDQFALSAIESIFSHLRMAVENGQNLEARSAVMMGSTLAGLAFGTGGTSAAHAIQYPIGAETHTPHGLGIGVLMPYVIEHNLAEATQTYAQIAYRIGAADRSMNEKTAAKIFLSELRSLFLDIGIPATLEDIGVKQKSLEAIAEMSLGAARLVDNNPRKLDKEGMLSIVTNAFNGTHKF